MTCELDNIMNELAQYMRVQDETAAIIDGLKDQIKAYMSDNKIETLIGTSHKASYKTVTSNRIDTAAIKRDLPEVATKYTKTTTGARFVFN